MSVKRKFSRLIVIIAAVLMPSCSAIHQRPSIARVALWSATATDLTSTQIVMRHGGREGNVIAGQQPWRQSVTVIGSTAVADILISRLQPATQKRFRTVLAGMHFSFTAWNIGQIR